ncbi:TonB-dependent receptor [Aureibacter tunicatorum]|uniref:Outer membrane receptor for ferrienterochelin and colicin n=1 Tax=Aureibacter tunicatorum TaxID=866807 RepID=A0AAE4BSI5_9BACT|nr:TonB-dependent receptor [Aureibacter tunicatorum]MDR6238452.1 outer membrane receptor for ferrienterochelin and colicin [Aureibacter tunicatorum]BDD05614.1 TonB-dependent receptor [Aureibacter tunicatorum]
MFPTFTFEIRRGTGMRNIGVTFILLFCCLTNAFSQGVKGKVFDDEGEPLIGATVRIENTTIGESTGLDGSFQLKLSSNAKYRVIASYVSYEDKVLEVDVNGSWEEVNFVLSSSLQQLDEIVVTANQDRSTDMSARKTEKMAPRVMSVVSAKTIELSPDLNVANVVQRVSGVSLERNNSGDGQFAIVRGMDKRYNYTLVNGVKIPSPDNKNRYVPLDLFPSDLLDRLEVTKALTPDMEGDAVGGVINMEMKDAPEQYSGQFNLALGYNTLMNNQDFLTWDKSGNMVQPPSWKHGGGHSATVGKDFGFNHLVLDRINLAPNTVLGGSIGNRFLDNKLGVILAGSYQQTYRGSESVFFQAAMSPNASGRTELQNMEERTYSQIQKRAGVHSKIDYRINPNHNISLYNAFVYLQNDQVRDVLRTRVWGSYDPINGNAGEMSAITRYRITRQQILTSTLKGDHKLNNWLKADWAGVYSFAKNQIPDNTRFSRNLSMENWEYTPERIAGRSSLRRQWDENEDRDVQMYGNFIMTPDLNFATESEFKVGGMMRLKNRTNDYERYTFNASNGRTMVKGVDWHDISDVDWVIETPLGSSPALNKYEAHEDIYAAYAQFRFLFEDKFQVLGGVRMEHTSTGYTMLDPSNPVVEQGIASKDYNYTDILPSLHLKYNINPKSSLRSSYFASVIRPGFAEFVPIVNGDTETDYLESGNPFVERTHAHNFDLRYELFPSGMDKFMIGGFYKRIINPIEYVLNLSRGEILPENLGDATNIGLEVDVIKYFNKIGFSANYTFTHSEITSDKTIVERQDPSDPNSDITARTVRETRSLQGQAAHIANISLLYKDMDTGWNAQIASVFTGDRIHEVSAYYQNDIWQKGFWQLDVSVEKEMKNGLTVYLKANNLLDNAYELEIRQPLSNSEALTPYQGNTGDNILVRRDLYGRQFLLGMKYNF